MRTHCGGSTWVMWTLRATRPASPTSRACRHASPSFLHSCCLPELNLHTHLSVTAQVVREQGSSPSVSRPKRPAVTLSLL